MTPAHTDATVVVVDDDASIRRALARLIRTAGLGVQTFASGDELLRGGGLPSGPACLLLDLQMPGMSGLELQRALSGGARQIPIVFLTGHGDVPTTAQAMRSGAQDFLEKPFQPRQLLEAIKRALDRDRDASTARSARARLNERYHTLTPREREVMALVVTGLLNKQVAAELGTSEKTIKVHRARVMEKMGADSLAALVRMAEQLDAPLPGEHLPVPAAPPPHPAV